MGRFAVSIVGLDRPGIVAAVTAVFAERSCNLQDCDMTVLNGHLGMTLVVEAPYDLDADTLQSALAGTAEAMQLTAIVQAVADDPPGSPGGERYSMAVYGSDHPGIVHAIAQVLASESINIDDLSTRLVGGAERPVYVMALELTIPSACDPEALAARLDELASELDVSCNLHRAEADVL
jgi:glycine cleavage system transcriptional repressor